MEDKQGIWNQIVKGGTCLALLICLQWITGFTASFAGSYLTDFCTAGVLTGITLTAGLWIGAGTALLAPFCAYVFHMGPELFQAVPAVAMGNLALVIGVFALFWGRKCGFFRTLISAAAAAGAGSAVSYLAVIQVLIPVMGPSLPAAQEEILREMFSWNQWITAFLGISAALGLLMLNSRRKKK